MDKSTNRVEEMHPKLKRGNDNGDLFPRQQIKKGFDIVAADRASGSIMIAFGIEVLFKYQSSYFVENLGNIVYNIKVLGWGCMVNPPV
ncbi:MAG: hypothetical protein QNK37_28745 [Acidobacteriota bacterium]|nr:hypothetical protein [Acidobacteriota bacterium]